MIYVVYTDPKIKLKQQKRIYIKATKFPHIYYNNINEYIQQ